MKPEPIHIDLTNPYYLRWVGFLRQSEDWSRDQVAGYQLNELKRITRYAYEHTTGYRRLFYAAGMSPDGIKSLEDIRKLPLVDKEMIRDELEDYSVNISEREYITTGGSTGIPFGFYRDKTAFAKELASKAFQYYRVGWKEGVHQLVLRGLPIDTQDHFNFKRKPD